LRKRVNLVFDWREILVHFAQKLKLVFKGCAFAAKENNIMSNFITELCWLQHAKLSTHQDSESNSFLFQRNNFSIIYLHSSFPSYRKNKLTISQCWKLLALNLFSYSEIKSQMNSFCSLLVFSPISCKVQALSTNLTLQLVLKKCSQKGIDRLMNWF
jgi:hypothetical protein